MVNPPGFRIPVSGHDTLNLTILILNPDSYSQQNGNKPMHTDPFIDPNIQLDPQSAFLWTSSRPGNFDIAVRYDEDNTFIGSLNDKKGRHYPCEAGRQSPFKPRENLDEFRSQEAAAKRLAHFLEKSGLHKSADFKQGCGAHSIKIWMSDRQRCEDPLSTSISITMHAFTLLAILLATINLVAQDNTQSRSSLAPFPTWLCICTRRSPGHVPVHGQRPGCHRRGSRRSCRYHHRSRSWCQQQPQSGATRVPRQLRS